MHGKALLQGLFELSPFLHIFFFWLIAIKVCWNLVFQRSIALSLICSCPIVWATFGAITLEVYMAKVAPCTLLMGHCTGCSVESKSLTRVPRIEICLQESFKHSRTKSSSLSAQPTIPETIQKYEPHAHAKIRKSGKNVSPFTSSRRLSLSRL